MKSRRQKKKKKTVSAEIRLFSFHDPPRASSRYRGQVQVNRRDGHGFETERARLSSRPRDDRLRGQRRWRTSGSPGVAGSHTHATDDSEEQGPAESIDLFTAENTRAHVRRRIPRIFRAPGLRVNKTRKLCTHSGPERESGVRRRAEGGGGGGRGREGETKSGGRRARGNCFRATMIPSGDSGLGVGRRTRQLDLVRWPAHVAIVIRTLTRPRIAVNNDGCRAILANGSKRSRVFSRSSRCVSLAHAAMIKLSGRE